MAGHGMSASVSSRRTSTSLKFEGARARLQPPPWSGTCNECGCISQKRAQFRVRCNRFKRVARYWFAPYGASSNHSSNVTYKGCKLQVYWASSSQQNHCASSLTIPLDSTVLFARGKYHTLFAGRPVCPSSPLGSNLFGNVPFKTMVALCYFPDVFWRYTVVSESVSYRISPKVL